MFNEIVSAMKGLEMNEEFSMVKEDSICFGVKLINIFGFDSIAFGGHGGKMEMYPLETYSLEEIAEKMKLFVENDGWEFDGYEVEFE